MRVDRSRCTGEREYAHRAAVARVNGRLDVSWAFELHTIRGMAKRLARCNLALLVMLGMARGGIRQQHPELLRSSVRSAKTLRQTTPPTSAKVRNTPESLRVRFMTSFDVSGTSYEMFLANGWNATKGLRSAQHCATAAPPAVPSTLRLLPGTMTKQRRVNRWKRFSSWFADPLPGEECRLNPIAQSLLPLNYTEGGFFMIARDSTQEPRWWTRLIWDEAFVTTGAQFREVALPLLMVALWRGSQSYALALFAVYLPSVVLARYAGQVADSVEPKRLILLSYAARVVGVAALLVAHQVPVAVAAVALLGTGMAINAPALTHYQASSTAYLNQLLVSRLRLVDSVSQLVMPVLAGGLVTAGGRNLGFLVSLACYLAAFAVMAGLPSVGAGGVHTGGAPRVRLVIPRAVMEQMAVGGVVAALSWMANVLYTAYILVDLHAGALRYGLALGVWGGAGLLSAAILPRVNPSRPERWIAVLIVVLGAAWAVMTRPVGYWVVVGLGLPEGFATFLLVDLIQSRILTEASPGERGQWQSASGAWTAGGRMTGLAVASVLPWLSQVHLTFGGLALLTGILALFWTVRTHRRHKTT